MLKTWDEIGAAATGPGGSIREDLRDFVENVSATDRPLLALLKKSRVATTFVEWLSEELASRAFNAQVEGAAFTDQALTVPERANNFVQTFARWGMVTDVQRAVDHAGLEDMFFHQERKSVNEVLNDIEHALHRGSAATGASGGTKRQLDGFLNFVSTNLTSSSGTTLTEDVFGDIVQLFADGDYDVRPSVCVANSWLKRTISQYSTRVTRNVQAAEKIQQLVVDEYESDFGRMHTFYSRDQLKGASKAVSGNSFMVLDPDFFETGWLQPLMSETLSRDGLRSRFQISAMLTVVYRTEKAAAVGKGYVPYVPVAT